MEIKEISKVNMIQVIESVLVVVGFDAIFQHTIGFTWRPVLMVEEETGKFEERTTNPRETTGKLSHISTFAES